MTDYSGITFKIDAAFDTGFAKAGVKKYFMNIDYDKDDSDPGNVLEHVQLTLYLRENHNRIGLVLQWVTDKPNPGRRCSPRSLRSTSANVSIAVVRCRGFVLC